MTPTPNNEALADCPFCATKAHFFRIDDPDNRDFGGEGICCQTTGCASVGLMWSLMDDCKPALAERWNRRALASSGQAASAVLTREQIIEVAKRMYRQPWGIGSRVADAVEFAEAILLEAASPTQPGQAASAVPEGVAEWLKDGETVLQRLERERNDTLAVTGLLGKERERAAALEELLTSAHAIALRQGESTAWDRFANSISALGIGSVTARTYRASSTQPASAPAREGDERAAFEAWARDEWPNGRAPDNAWLGWKARASVPPAAPAQPREAQAKWDGSYRGKCADGRRCLQGCYSNESCHWESPKLQAANALIDEFKLAAIGWNESPNENQPRERYRNAHAALFAALSTPPAPREPSIEAVGEAKLWLWQNGDHFWAFDNLYPCFTPGGDPMTLGEPVGYAIFKPSHCRSGKESLGLRELQQFDSTQREWRK